jgi:hypothetical protein
MNQKTKTGPDAGAPNPEEPQVEALAPEEELHPAEALEVAVMEMLSSYSQPHLTGQYDQRLIAIARTQIELGFLALYRALAKHEAAAQGEAV